MTTTQTQTLRAFCQTLLHQGADIAVYAKSLASRVGCTADDVMAMAATLGPARVVHPGDLASERRAADAQMTRAQRAHFDHEED